MFQAFKTAQKVKALIARPDNQNSISRTHLVDGHTFTVAHNVDKQANRIKQF